MTATAKWKAVFGIYFQECVAYRASAVIWLLTDVSTAIIMPFVWASAGRASINGYTVSDLVLYYLCYLGVQSFVTSHIMWEIAMEIKDGAFSVALLRPINYLAFTFFRSLSWRIFRTFLFMPLLAILLFAYRGLIHDSHLHLDGQFFLAVVLGHLVSFTFVTAMAMLALYVQEARAIFELYYIPMLFLSGSLFPIAMLPEWARNLSYAFPFYFTTGLPTEILVGRMPSDKAWILMGGQVAWIAFAFVAGRLLFKGGMKRYSAVGM